MKRATPPAPQPPLSEHDIQTQILEYLQKVKIPAWRSNTGVGRKGGRWIRFGLKGSADITGLLPPSGRRLEIEVKVKRELHYTDRNPAQVAFETMIDEGGGLYIRTASLEDLQAQLEVEKGSPQ